MSEFTEATKSLELSIVVGGEKKQVKLGKEDYYYLSREKEKIPVIKHDALIRMADANGVKVDKTFLEFGVFHSPNNFCFVHRAVGTLADGTVVDEVGEANPQNLNTVIGGAYPAIMSNKRAQDRLLIRLMGLQGKVYSDVEFGGNIYESDKTEKEEEIKMTIDEAKSLIVDYGSYKKSPVTLGELKEKAPQDFEWLLNTYTVTAKSSEKMKRLHYGAKILAAAE